LRIIVFLSIFLSAASHSEERRDVFKELLLRGVELEPESIIITCRNDDWCQGYFTAVIHGLKNGGAKLCIPTNDVGRQIDKGVWSIIEAWL
jgi:hypothetical protein